MAHSCIATADAGMLIQHIDSRIVGILNEWRASILNVQARVGRDCDKEQERFRRQVLASLPVHGALMVSSSSGAAYIVLTDSTVPRSRCRVRNNDAIARDGLAAAGVNQRPGKARASDVDRQRGIEVFDTKARRRRSLSSDCDGGDGD